MNQPEILNPIVHESAVPLFWFGELSRSRTGHTAAVYLVDPQVRQPADPGTARPPGLRERIRRTHWRYEVDIAHHWTSLTLDLPTQEEAFSFKVWVSLTWQVGDPGIVARKNVRDLQPIIWGFLDQHLRTVSRRHSIEQAGHAEEEMNEFLDRKLGDVDYGLRLSLVSINVRPDEAAQQYLSMRVESRRARTLAGDDHELETLRRNHAAELARHKGDLEREHLAHAAEIDRLRADQERMAAEHDLRLKEQRMKFYHGALRGGGYDVLVLHLIEHPQDIQTVAQMLHEGRKDQYDRARDVIQHLITNHLMNAADAETMREDAFHKLRTAFDVAAPTVTIKNEKSTKTTEEKETTSVEMPLT